MTTQLPTPAPVRQRVLAVAIVAALVAGVLGLAAAPASSASEGGEPPPTAPELTYPHLVQLASLGQAPEGESWTPSISDDGRYVVFGSAAEPDAAPSGGYGAVYRHDRQTGETSRLVEVVDHEGSPVEAALFATTAVIAGDGVHVAFTRPSLDAAPLAAAASTTPAAKTAYDVATEEYVPPPMELGVLSAIDGSMTWVDTPVPAYQVGTLSVSSSRRR